MGNMTYKNWKNNIKKSIKSSNSYEEAVLNILAESDKKSSIDTESCRHSCHLSMAGGGKSYVCDECKEGKCSFATTEP